MAGVDEKARPLPTAVADLMEALFVDRLAPVYGAAGSVAEPALDSFAFTAYRQQVILRSSG